MYYIKSIRKIITILFVILIFATCNNSTKETTDKVSQWMGDTLSLPKITKVLYNDSLLNCNFPLNEKANLKITTLLWGDCHACMEDLKKWDEFFQYSSSKKKIEMFFYLYTSNLHFFRENLYIQNIYKYPLIIDQDFNYIDKNNIPLKDKTYQTFLLDSNNKVILVGNPINNEKLKELYMQEIGKRIRE